MTRIVVEVHWVNKGKGIKRRISRSNTIKITPRRKKWRENGTRALEWASNPHSNVLRVSREVKRLLAITQFTTIRATGSAATTASIKHFVNIDVGSGHI